MCRVKGRTKKVKKPCPKKGSVVAERATKKPNGNKKHAKVVRPQPKGPCKSCRITNLKKNKAKKLADKARLHRVRSSPTVEEFDMDLTIDIHAYGVAVGGVDISSIDDERVTGDSGQPDD